MVSKKNMVTYGVLAAALVLVIIPAVFLFRGIRGFKGEEAKLVGSESMLDRQYARNPFPSEENVVLERDNVDVLDRELETLIAAVRKGEVAPLQITPATFIAQYQQIAGSLRGMATQSGTILPGEFAFGFQRYRAEGTLPAPEDVPRLTQQLNIIENLARVLFEEKIKDLTWLEREEFEASAAAAVKRPDPSRPKFHNPKLAPPEESAAVTESASSQAGLIGEDDIYAKFRFGLEFKATEKTFRAVLNRFSAHGMFVVVTSVSMEKTGSDIMPIPQSAAPAAAAGAVPGSAAAPGVPVGLPSMFAVAFEKAPPVEARKPTWEERIICGETLETPMKIRMELAVYRFKERGAPGDGV